MEIDPCEHCGTDLAPTLPYVGLLSRCRHCRKLLAHPRKGGGLRALPVVEENARPSSKLRTGKCPACGETVIVVRPDPLGRSYDLELHALDNFGEMTALMQKRKTFDLCSDGTADLRFAWDITARPAETHWITHTQHVCLKLLGSVQRFTARAEGGVETLAGAPPY